MAVLVRFLMVEISAISTNLTLNNCKIQSGCSATGEGGGLNTLTLQGLTLNVGSASGNSQLHGV
jgi:hypothetical protein